MMLPRSRRKYFPSIVWLVFVAVVALLVGSGPAFAQDAGEDDVTTGLFADAAVPLSLPTNTEITMLRARYVTVKFDQLSADKLGNMTLDLFGDVRINAAITGVDLMGDGGYVLKGGIQGENEAGVVTLSVLGKTLQGNITTQAGQMYAIRYVSEGVHAIYQVDPTGFGRDGDSIMVNIPIKTGLADTAAANANADLAPTINVLVVYTDDARAAAGGATAIQNTVNLAVSETNTGYANSGVSQRISLVYKGEVNYAESGNISTDLSRLRATADGQIDSVHSLRDTYAADMVAMITENGGGYCGIAYLMTSVSTAFKTNAFSVTARNCSTGYYSFGHELGHNMGARHDSYVDSGTTPYAYSHGWVNVGAKWRTIMAYNDACAASGVSCTRKNNWSNPNVLIGGAVTGNANTAHNARTLNNTAATVAAFR